MSREGGRGSRARFERLKIAVAQHAAAGRKAGAGIVDPRTRGHRDIVDADLALQISGRTVPVAGGSAPCWLWRRLQPRGAAPALCHVRLRAIRCTAMTGMRACLEQGSAVPACAAGPDAALRYGWSQLRCSLRRGRRAPCPYRPCCASGADRGAGSAPPSRIAAPACTRKAAAVLGLHEDREGAIFARLHDDVVGFGGADAELIDGERLAHRCRRPARWSAADRECAHRKCSSPSR